MSFSMLVLESKKHEIFVLTDAVTGTRTEIKTYFRGNGNFALGFNAPKTIGITREKQRSDFNGNDKNKR